jgi:hypothetical protein
VSMAQRAAKAAIKVLEGRGGFDHWWDEIDDEIKAEIMDEMMTEIDKVIDG